MSRPVSAPRMQFVLALAATCPSGTAGAQDSGVGVEKVVLKAVMQFNFNDTAVVPADADTLLAGVGKMQDVTWQTITTTGHTDSVGRVAYNQRLSEQRANNVQQFLVTKGIDDTLVRTQGLGASQPAAANGTRQGRAQDRRAEVEFSGVRMVQQ